MSDAVAQEAVESNAFRVLEPGLPALDRWQSKVISFRYSLSYVKLFEIRFKALEDPRPFEPDRPAASDILAPVSKVPERFDVVTLRHQPLLAEIPVIKRVQGMIRYVP